MTELQSKLKPFARRVRWMTAWKGLAIGALVGGGLALVWAILDWIRVFYADWRGLGLVVGIATLVGAILGFLRVVSPSDLASSIDTRASLKDRVTTAVEEPSKGATFQEAQVQDADKALAGLNPAGLYPVRFGKWQMGAIASVVIAASVFLLGNSPIVRGPKTPSEREELKEIGKKVERVAKPLEKPVNGVEVPASQKKLASELNKFAKELEEGKLNKEEALRKANDMASKAEDEARSLAEETQKKTEEIETSLGKFDKMKLDEAGVSQEDLAKMNLSPEEQASLDQIMREEGIENPKSQFGDKELEQMGASRTAEKLAQLSPQQREQLRKSVAKRQEALQKEMDRIDKLPEAERKKLEKEQQELMKQQQEMQKLSQALKLSEETMKALRELMDSPEMKKLREMMAKMQEKSQQMQQQGKPMSKEDMEKLKQQLEELAKAMKDPKLKEQVMQQLRDALKQLESGQMSLESMQQMMSAMGMEGSQRGQQDPNGDPSVGTDDNFADTGKIVKSDKEMETKGKTTATRVNGEWEDKKGEQWSVTVKAPTQVGNRSSVPYQSVMPKYRKAAEKALSGGKIPRGKEKRVKEYFESLSGGKK